MSAEVPHVAQCEKNGCAGAILTNLRVHGCSFQLFVGRDQFVVIAPTTEALLALDVHLERIAAHTDRIAMLLWAEAAGRN